MSAVLGRGRGARRVIVLALVAALFVHGTAAARAAGMPLELMRWSQRIGRAIHERIVGTYDLDIVKAPEPPPPPPEPVKDEPKDAPPPPAAAPSSAKTAPTDAPPPAPAAAQAGAVLTQQPDPNEPVDLTNSFVTGDSDSYVGGVTQSNGTSATAVYGRAGGPGGPAASRGVAVATGPTSGGATDRSRAASLAGSKDWKCEFPPEADIDQIDQAYVVVKVATRANGSPESVAILSDPGHGFGRAARLCAMKEHYDPALDTAGNAVVGSTKSIRIRFER